MRVGLVGWRGMVGSVLMQRMVEEKDFDLIEPVYYSTSQIGIPAPVLGGKDAGLLQDAFDIDSLKQLDAVITCQGGDYTSKVYPALRQAGWKVTGLMQLLLCVWTLIQSSLLILLTWLKFSKAFTVAPTRSLAVTVL